MLLDVENVVAEGWTWANPRDPRDSTQDKQPGDSLTCKRSSSTFSEFWGGICGPSFRCRHSGLLVDAAAAVAGAVGSVAGAAGRSPAGKRRVVGWLASCWHCSCQPRLQSD